MSLRTAPDGRASLGFLQGCAVFLVTASAYVVLGPDAPQGGDTVPNRYLPLGVSCANLTLDRFHPLWSVPGRDPRTRFPYYATMAPSGHLVSTFGPAVPILSFPFYAVADALWGICDSQDVLRVSRVLAGLLCALAAALVFAACRLVASLPASLVATLAFAFGSGVFSVASRGLWQHTWALPMLALGTFALLRGEGRPASWQAALVGASFAVAFACRPQTGFFLAAGTLALAQRGREAVLFCCLAAFPVLALVFAYNTWYFDSPFVFAQTVRSHEVALYKTGSASLIGAKPWVAALGLLASPSRGLFIFSPVFAVGLAALLPERVKTSPARRPLLFLAVAAFGLFATAALWFDWWGGHTLSYRPLLETLPVLAVLSARGLDRFRMAWARAVFLVLLAWSMILALAAVLHPGAVLWNEARDVDHHPERLWDVRESLPARLLEFRFEDRIPLRDSQPVRVVPCGVVPVDEALSLETGSDKIAREILGSEGCPWSPGEHRVTSSDASCRP